MYGPGILTNTQIILFTPLIASQKPELEDQYLCKPNIKGVIKSYIGHTMFEYSHLE